MNNSTKDIIKNSFMAAVGLFFFSFGVYMTIQANIGVAPWDAFNLGLSHTFGIKYGTASISVALAILTLDIAMREPIGIGMLLDAVLVGKFVDFFNFINVIKPQTKPLFSVIVMVAGIFVLCFSEYLYMKAALGCGPRDSFLVGLKRRLKRVPIGAINTVILAAVTLLGWLLGGPIGVGTLICAVLTGPILQLVFRILKFDPTEVRHQDIITSVKIIGGQK